MHKRWTKKELVNLLKMWDSMTLKEMAEKLGRDRNQIKSVVFQMRKAGIPIERKRVDFEGNHLIEEVKKELGY